MPGIEIERKSEDGLKCEFWRFNLSTAYGATDTVDIRLKFYGRSERDTLRHKFKFEPKDRFVSSDRREYNSGIAAARVPLPEDVAVELKSKILFRLIQPTE